jgi:hypothetical protein
MTGNRITRAHTATTITTRITLEHPERVTVERDGRERTGTARAFTVIETSGHGDRGSFAASTSVVARVTLDGSPYSLTHSLTETDAARILALLSGLNA